MQESTKHNTDNTASEQSSTFVLNKENSKQYGDIKGDKVIEKEKIENTPFHIVTVNMDGENKSFIAIGDKRVSELTNNTTELKTMINNNDWRLITALITIITERVYEQIELEQITRNEKK